MKKVLYFIQLPPPLHGVSKTNDLVYNSKVINHKIKKRLITVNYSSYLSSINQFSITKVFKYFRLYFNFFKELLFFRPDFIYYTIPPTGIGLYKDLPFVFLMKLLFIKPLYHLHGKGIAKNTKNSKLKLIIHKWVYSNSYIIHLSKNLMQAEIEPLGLRKSDFFVVNNGVAKVNFTSKQESNTNRIDILFLSNLFVSKGILFALEILAGLVKENKNIHLHIIGKYPDDNTKNIIEKELSNQKLHRHITVYGPLFGEDKFQIMSKTDFLLYPSFNDAYPLVILEALQLGLPIIASDQGAIPEIVNRDVGYVFKTGDLNEAKSLCSQMIAKLSENRTYYYQNCIESYKNKFTIKRFEKEMTSVFNEILCVE